MTKYSKETKEDLLVITKELESVLHIMGKPYKVNYEDSIIDLLEVDRPINRKKNVETLINLSDYIKNSIISCNDLIIIYFFKTYKVSLTQNSMALEIRPLKGGEII